MNNISARTVHIMLIYGTTRVQLKVMIAVSIIFKMFWFFSHNQYSAPAAYVFHGHGLKTYPRLSGKKISKLSCSQKRLMFFRSAGKGVVKKLDNVERGKNCIILHR